MQRFVQLGRLRLRAFSALAVAVGFAAAAQSARATPVYYVNDPVSSRAAFQADASGPLSLESFEDPFGTSASLSFPVGGPEAFVVTSNDLISQSDGSFALFIREGQTLTFLFDQPIHSFGIDVNDLTYSDMFFTDDLGNSLVPVLSGDGGAPDGGPGFENRQFFGVTNDAGFQMVRLSFSAPGALANLYFDRLEFGTAVIPEPDSALLLGFGLALVALGRRR